MKVLLEINTTAPVDVDAGVAQRLGNAALVQVRIGKTEGTVTETNGTASFKVERNAKAAE